MVIRENVTLLKNLFCNLHTQQTPKPAAQDPSFDPPLFEHSSLNMYDNESIKNVGLQFAVFFMF